MYIDSIKLLEDTITVPKVVLGHNSDGQEVYLYFDEELQKVVICGAIGIAYEQIVSGSSKVYSLDITSPSLG